MKRRQVWRYSCEFCKKSNCSASAISKHEQRCTLNPDRVCGMCQMLKQKQADLPSVIFALPKPVLFQESDCGDTLTWPDGVDTAGVYANLKTLTRGCPACIMAAIRQAKIPVPMIPEFDYTKECEAVWALINEEDPQPWLA